jgi:hypothetical protein
MKVFKFSVLTLACLLIASVQTANSQWKSLTGKDLSGWETINGKAPYSLKKGVVTGTTVVNSPNTFLCTKEKYGDFILEFETKFDSRMNSGVQIRSESKPDYMEGRVHGYQVELDPSDRAWSGGIYDEARRGWLYTLDINPEGKKAFRKDEWNKYRVEAIGNSIRTWVNGIPCADLIDDMTPSGFIALQVHSIGKDSTKAGLKVMWKNIRIISSDVSKYATPYTPVIPQVSYLKNKLTKREEAEGWQLLWDGKTNAGWRGANLPKFPESGWQISGGELTVLQRDENSKSGGDIITTGLFGDFELSVDFRYTKGANSGIKYFIDAESDNGKRATVGCEYQILDDRNHPDAKAGINGNRTLGGLYDLIPPAEKRDNGPDKWNRAKIIVRGSKVEHWLNGQKTVEYERGSDAWKEAFSKSKFRNMPWFAATAKGHILLQDHGNTVSFTNIKIRELK